MTIAIKVVGRTVTRMAGELNVKGWGKVRPWPLSPRLRSLEHGQEPIEAPSAAPTEHEEGDRPKALIGTTEAGGLGTKIWFDPDWPAQRLANGHMSITGESGSGKTQSMKSIMADLQTKGIPALVLDFKDDYAEPGYAGKQGFSVHDPTKSPLPLNPLFPGADPQSGQVNVVYHAYQISEILERIYGLGDIQGYRLREAIKEVYADAGLPATPFVPAPGQQFPVFQAVKDKLAKSKDNAELIGHMSPIFDFGFFSATEAGNFASIANSNTVIRLGQLPGNEIKNAVAEFFLMALYNHLIRQPQTHTLTRLLILDEAWRLVNSPFLEPLMREGRAFGLGIFVATQFPTDLPLAVSGSTATQLFFSQTSPGQIAEIERIVSGHTSGSEADAIGDDIRSMPPLTCIVHNKQYEPYVKATAHAFFQRTGAMAPDNMVSPQEYWDRPVHDPRGQICNNCGEPIETRGNGWIHSDRPRDSRSYYGQYCMDENKVLNTLASPKIKTGAVADNWEREPTDPRGHICNNCGEPIEFSRQYKRGAWIHSDRPPEHRAFYEKWCINKEQNRILNGLATPKRRTVSNWTERDQNDPRGNDCDNCGKPIEFTKFFSGDKEWIHSDRPASQRPTYALYCMNDAQDEYLRTPQDYYKGKALQAIPKRKQAAWEHFPVDPVVWDVSGVTPCRCTHSRDTHQGEPEIGNDWCDVCGCIQYKPHQDWRTLGDPRGPGQKTSASLSQCSKCKSIGNYGPFQKECPKCGGKLESKRPKSMSKVAPPTNLKTEVCVECGGGGGCICAGQPECDMCGGNGLCANCDGKGFVLIDPATQLAGYNSRHPHDPRGPKMEMFSQAPAHSYICSRCQATTTNSNHICDSCAGTVDKFEDTDSSTDTDGDHGTERVVGDPNFAWQHAAGVNPKGWRSPNDPRGLEAIRCKHCDFPIFKDPELPTWYHFKNYYTRDGDNRVPLGERCPAERETMAEPKTAAPKTAEIVPFPPGEEVEGENPFAEIQQQEQFFQSPRNRNRKSRLETSGFKNGGVEEETGLAKR